MALDMTVHYEAQPDEVYAMVTDPAFQVQAMAATGALNHHVDVEAAGQAHTVVTRRTLATTRAPESVRRVLGPTVLVTQEIRWHPARADGARTGALTAGIEGVPVTVSGEVLLAPVEHGESVGTDQTVRADIEVRIPLVGGRIADAVRPVLESALDAEHRTGVAWLADEDA